MMAWRRIIEEYEADLYRVPTPKLFRRAMGELERKTFADGEELLEIGFHGIDVPDGSRVSVVIDGASVCNVEVERGRARLDLSSEDGHAVPAVGNGDVVEIQFEGQALLRGTFRPD